MSNFINIKDISSKDLRKILNDAKKRKNKRKKLSTLDIDRDRPLEGKLLIQMYEQPSSRTRLAINFVNCEPKSTIIILSFWFCDTIYFFCKFFNFFSNSWM